LELDSTSLLFAFICFGFPGNTFNTTFLCRATIDFIFLVCNASVSFFYGVSVKTLDLPGLRSFLIDPLDCALEMAVFPELILEEFQLFCLLKVLIELGRQPVD
jgi:hypothetical protein